MKPKTLPFLFTFLGCFFITQSIFAQEINCLHVDPFNNNSRFSTSGSSVFSSININSNGSIDIPVGITQTYVIVDSGVTFLKWWPNARSASMGGLGIALEPDATAVSFNSSNLVFAKSKFGINQTYIPLFNSGNERTGMHHAGAYFKINEANVIAASFRYFNLGTIGFIGSQDYYRWYSRHFEDVKDDRLFELESLISYNRKLTTNLAAGVSAKYIVSKVALDGWELISGVLEPAQTVALDFSLTHQKPLKLGNKKAKLISGFALTNVGKKISQVEIGETKCTVFLPANLGIGTGLIVELAKNHSLTLSADVNRLLVPKPGFEHFGSLKGIWFSFSDAPGGFVEEWQENQYSFGLEYHYKAIYIRHGYFMQHKTKGNKQFMANGIGVKAFGLGLDFSYILSLNQIALPESYRMTVSCDLGSNK